MLKNFGQMAKVNCLQILPAKHEVTSIDPKYYDRHAEMSEYRMPYCQVIQPKNSTTGMRTISRS
jgi:hypothetical protein